MAKQYFRKELLTNAVILRGKPVAFEALDGNRGLLVIDEDDQASSYIIEALNERANRHVQGIVKISEEEYTDLKKNLQPIPSARQKEYLRTMAQPSPGRKKEAPSPAPVPPANVVPPATPATPAPVPTPAAPVEPPPPFRAPTGQELGQKHFPATEPASPSLPTPETPAPNAGSTPPKPASFTPTMAPLQEVQSKADENLKAAQKEQQKQTVPKPSLAK